MDDPSATALRRRWWVLAATAGLAIVLVVALVLVAPTKRIAGTAAARDPATVSTAALVQLGELGDIRLTGRVSTEFGHALGVDIVSAGDTIQAVVHDEAGGVAEFLVAGNQAAVKANVAWWLNTIPAFAQEHQDKWVKADDNMGFPVSALRALTGSQLKKMLAVRTSGETWTTTPTRFVNAEPALAVSTGDSGWTVFVSPTDPPRLLGFGGPLFAGPHRLSGAQGSAGFPYAELTVSAPDLSCLERATRQAQQTGPTINTLPAPHVPGIDERPSLSIQVLPGAPICSTPSCPFNIIVANTGTAPGVGTLSVSSTSGPPLAVPLSVGPGGQFTQVYNAPNPAANGRVTVPIYVRAFAQITSLAGPDLDAGRRLSERGVDPNKPIPGRPAAVGPGVTDMLDRLTVTAPPQGFGLRYGAPDDVVQKARDLVGTALTSRLSSLLRELVAAPALRFGADVSRSPLVGLIEQAANGRSDQEKASAVRTLELLVRLTSGKPAPPTPEQAPIHVENGIVFDDTTQQAYRVTALPESPKPGADEVLLDAIGRTADELANATVPPGYARVVELHLIGSGPGGSGNLSRAQLTDRLRTMRWNGKSLADLLLDSGKSSIDGLSVASPATSKPGKGATGGTITFDRNDLEALGQTKSATPPSQPPSSGTFTPRTRQHTLDGDPYDQSDTRDNGGHRHGTGVSEKTEFPKDWTDEDIERAAIELINRANADRSAGRTGPPNSAATTDVLPPAGNTNQMGVEAWSWLYRGTVNGVEMEAVLLNDGTIRTAYPTGRIADSKGNLVLAPPNPTLSNIPFQNPKLPGVPSPDPANPKASLTQTARPRYVRPATPTGQGSWAFEGTTKGPAGSTQAVRVTTDQNGKNPQVQQLPMTQAPPPTPAVCAVP